MAVPWCAVFLAAFLATLARPMVESFYIASEDDDGDSEDGESVWFEIEGPTPSPPKFELLDAADNDFKVALVRGFASEEEITRIHVIGTDPDLEEELDRDGELLYKHHVWRIEQQLEGLEPHIYDRLIGTARGLDKELWHHMQKGDVFFPEIEYISYNVKKLGEPGSIEPHVDNESVVTMVLMLSSPNDFVGGVSFFAEDDDDNVGRSVQLQQGDAVFFYGNGCEHWISPVTAGERIVLQVEIAKQ